MPEISRFLGIKISIYYEEHNPPHFHAKYGNDKAVFTIKELKLIQGKLSPRVKSLVLEWADLHRDELLEDWNLAKENETLKKIKGLE
jgi:hypothetical protein